MAILNGIQHLHFKNGWVNEGYVFKDVYGVDELRKKVEKYTPELVEKISAVLRTRKSVHGGCANYWDDEESSVDLFTGSLSV